MYLHLCVCVCVYVFVQRTFFRTYCDASSSLAFFGIVLSIRGIGTISSATSCLAAIDMTLHSPSNVFDLLFEEASATMSMQPIITKKKECLLMCCVMDYVVTVESVQDEMEDRVEVKHI